MKWGIPKGRSPLGWVVEFLMKNSAATELPVIQHTYDLILWFVPILNRLPRDHKFS